MRTARCKKYHQPLSGAASGVLRALSDRQSKCPGWASNEVRDILLATAIVEDDQDLDCFGRPRKVWNAVAGWTFVGVSTGEQSPTYNCYPEAPTTKLAARLAILQGRSLEDLMSNAGS